MRQKTDHTRSTCANSLTLISMVPAFDPVPAKCIISSLIKLFMNLNCFSVAKYN